MADVMFDALYNEFGKEAVDCMRRKLTTEKRRLPSYIELLAALLLQ